MSLDIPKDVPSNQFIHAGLMNLDGGLFNDSKRIGSATLAREIDFITHHATNSDLQTRGAWQQVRNVCLMWCFCYRTVKDNKALNNLLAFVGLQDLLISTAPLPQIFGAIEGKHNECPFEPSPSVAWIKARPPPQRLPASDSANGSAQGSSLPYPQMYQPSPVSNHNHNHSLPSVHPQVSVSTPFSSITATANATTTTTTNNNNIQAVVNVDLNSNPAWHGRFFFTEHKQEYNDHQFQCIFRCLKDGKHCRKAPVREMNRHLRERHGFRPGFKIAGVDWEKKRWRGAGANHLECVGKIVEKESADDSDSEDEDEGYVVE